MGDQCHQLVLYLYGDDSGGSDVRSRVGVERTKAVGAEDDHFLQCQVLFKCVNAVGGARKELVSEIAGIESPRMALDAA